MSLQLRIKEESAQSAFRCAEDCWHGAPPELRRYQSYSDDEMQGAGMISKETWVNVYLINEKSQIHVRGRGAADGAAELCARPLSFAPGDPRET
jgi:hypothetical protein